MNMKSTIGPKSGSMKPPIDLNRVKNLAGIDRAKAELVIQIVSTATGACVKDIRSNTRNSAQAARARQLAMYLAYVTFQWPLSRIGEAFGRDRTTAGHACRIIEDLRDDQHFDNQLAQIEQCLRCAPDPLCLGPLRLNAPHYVS